MRHSLMILAAALMLSVPALAQEAPAADPTPPAEVQAQAEVSPAAEVTVKLPIAAWQTVLAALGEVPKRYADPIDDAIRKQVAGQVAILRAKK